jgi:hypothetical protein
MDPRKQDFIRNPEIEKNLAPKGCDFFRTPDDQIEHTKQMAELDKVSTRDLTKDEKLEEAPKEVPVIKQEFKCNKCDYVTKNEKGIKIHITRRHKNERSGDGKEC